MIQEHTSQMCSQNWRGNLEDDSDEGPTLMEKSGSWLLDVIMIG